MTNKSINKHAVAACLTALTLSASTVPALGHHSFYAEFDPDKEVVLNGTVKEMQWRNPHSWLVLEVVNEKGETEEWMVEGGSPNVLMRLGWTRDSLPPGTKVIVHGFAAKDGAHRANSRGIEFPDGRVLDTGSSRQ